MVNLDQLDLDVKNRLYELSIKNNYDYLILRGHYLSELRTQQLNFNRSMFKNIINSYKLTELWALNEYYG